jgi:hypothetical protein
VITPIFGDQFFNAAWSQGLGGRLSKGSEMPHKGS